MPTHLISLLDRLADHRVLCVGDVMLDRYSYGRVDRISPEAPIPVLHIQREAMTLGGAGNVARNLVALGGRVDVVGLVGRDAAGDDIARELGGLTRATSHLVVDSSRPTTVKTRFVAEGQQLLRADQEQAQPLSPTGERDVLTQVTAAMDGCGAVILSDYAKGVLGHTLAQAIIALARQKNIPVLVDPKGRDVSRYHGADFLTPNRKELSEIAGAAIRSVEDAEQAARRLIAAHNLQGVLVKLGSDGVCLVMRDQPAVPFHTLAREVFDVSGAGDTVMATMALGIAGGLSPADAAQLANIAGSIVVGKVGTATVTRDDLARELMHDEARRGEDKIAGLPRATERAERWRQQGFRVGFTNGCFDLLHPGHIALLRQARAACDKLIVGLNSDASVKRLKGDSRPVQNENSRAAVLAALADVDQIVIFHEDTPLNVIQALRPSVLIKGADYRVDQVVGGDLVQAWGGQVILADLAEGHSTTGTIARMNKDRSAG